LATLPVQEEFKKYIEEGVSIDFSNSLLMPSLRVAYDSGIPVIHVVDKEKFLRHFKFS
jgi:hypothetical protein